MRGIILISYTPLLFCPFLLCSHWSRHRAGGLLPRGREELKERSDFFNAIVTLEERPSFME